MKNRSRVAVVAGAGAAVAVAAFVSCGGGGGGGGSRFQGNVSSPQASLEPAPPAESRFAWWSLGFVGTAWAQGSGIQVCLADSDICTTTDENGSFVLPVDGDLVAPVCLRISGSSFSANLCLPFDVPNGSVVNLRNIRCDLQDDTCEAEDVDFDEAGEDPSDEVSDEDGPSEPSEPSDDVSDVSDDDDVSDDNSGPGDGDDDVSDDD
ncbi:MAG: hypothetical protein ACREQ9_02800 [Candidatus Binatia bacterium]